MPELPEVEVLRRSLTPRLVGRRVRGVTVREARLREPVDATALGRAAQGRRVQRLRRRAKYLWIDFTGGQTVAVHLGMSGRLTVVAEDLPPAPHEHLALHLEGGERLRLVDPRRFGLVLPCPTAALGDDPHFASLGIEPLAGSLDGAFLRHAAASRRGPVKPFLMDSRVVVGIGNIYASEALFAARIHPRRSVARIGRERWQRLSEAVQRVLARAIGEGGTTVNDFVDGEGNSGYFQVSLAVYDRQGLPCPRCGRVVRRELQGGRSTFFCPGCQR
ncbi:MAG TPA: bifunctional DNA-formamidopyrimidine glycosylase/DNA-(apurinic or apyrimidinic site) lyase [Thermoanaerobaculia bacterium]|nr:bifunctional DNA-formamidopyrimidine glycosylase/DNA-(apurinic or apyrimidinic site) lyase [Thermoanaerobaculia bacterium]